VQAAGSKEFPRVQAALSTGEGSSSCRTEISRGGCHAGTSFFGRRALRAGRASVGARPSRLSGASVQNASVMEEAA